MTSISDVHDSAAGLTASSLHNAQVAGPGAAVNGASFDTIPNNAQELGSAQIYCDANANGNLALAGSATLALTIQDAPDNGGVPGVFADVPAASLMGAADGADGLPTNPVITLQGPAVVLPLVPLDADTFTMNLPLHRLRRHVRVISTWVVPGGDTVDFACSVHCGGNVIKPV